ncbi:S-adenosylmethionine mitochondrial carrier protein [Iris pallida]|uniref:S-adenosylmethionine mitochondrial carrier protein n=1 Tax=Iris pallida TaxID=29817 RepID=A0AAX6HFW1_IRIPA|nr:S-adenosylmethionine mitochondrial carrier protein [Iris pallida]
MQVQGTGKSWGSVVLKGNVSQKTVTPMYGYYTGMFQAGQSIWKQEGLKGLFAGYWPTIVRDVPFAGLMVTFYEALKDVTKYGKETFLPDSDMQTNGSFEGLILGGLSGGFSAYLTTPLDVIKTRLQVQGSTIRYDGWLDAFQSIWKTEGLNGMFKGSVPRILWYVPASALTFMAVEFLREQFNEKSDEITTLSIDTKSKLPKVA